MQFKQIFDLARRADPKQADEITLSETNFVRTLEAAHQLVLACARFGSKLNLAKRIALAGEVVTLAQNLMQLLLELNVPVSFMSNVLGVNARITIGLGGYTRVTTGAAPPANLVAPSATTN
jgi:hypothetical protein